MSRKRIAVCFSSKEGDFLACLYHPQPQCRGCKTCKNPNKCDECAHRCPSCTGDCTKCHFNCANRKANFKV